MMIKTEFFKNQFPSGITEEQRYTHMNKNKTLASQLINQIVEKDFVGAKDSFASLIRQKSLTRLGEKKIEVASRMFVSEARDTSPETLAKIKAADKSYSKMSTQELKKLYQQHYRVSNVSGMSKNNLIGDILRAEFGNKAVDMAFESVEETELDEAKNKLSDLEPMEQFELINDYLGIRQFSGVKHFRTDPNRAEDIIKSNNVDADKVKDAIERMKKDKRLDRSFTLSEDADLLDEAYVDRFAKKRKENGSELKDWTMKKLDMFRDMPHGSYTNKEIQQEYQRRIKTGEYVKA